MYTDKIIKTNPIVWCKNEAELNEAGKLFEEHTNIKAYAGRPPTNFCKCIYGIFGRIQRTDEPIYLVIEKNELHVGFDDPTLFYLKSRVITLDQFKEMF